MDNLQEIRFSQPWATYPILSKETLVPADPLRGILPIRLFKFGYPSGRSLGFRFTTQVIKMVRGDSGTHKSYSPTSEPDKEGEFHLMMRIYPGGGHSEWLDAQPIGTRVPFFGPIPPPHMAGVKVYSPGKRVVAIALGIGITECFTTCREELRKNDGTKVSLIYSVRYKDEIVLQKELNQLKEQFGDRFDITYLATKEDVKDGGWFHGRVDAQLVDKIIGNYNRNDTRVLVVGTKPMIRAVWDNLREIGLDFEKHSLVRKLNRRAFR